jgi:uncharacterized protein
MKKLFLYFLILFFPVLAFAFTVPARPQTYLSDYAGILSTKDSSAIESKLEAYEKQSTNEIAVVIINSLDGDTIENVAQEIFTAWGIGKKDKNNGVLFLISIGDHKTRIQTGYGVEGDLTDLGTSYIQSDIVTPAFRAGDYAGGINGAVDAMIQSLGGTQIVPTDYAPQNSSGNNFSWQFIFIAGFIFLQMAASILGRTKSWWFGGILGGVVGILLWYFLIHTLLLAIPVFLLLVGFGLLFDFLVSRAYQNHKDGGPRPPWFLGGGGFGGSGGGGGFGGFGGGMSGGGGSSGGW